MKVKWFTIMLFSIWFYVFYILVAGIYQKYSITKYEWIIITISTTLLMIIGNIIEEKYMKKKELLEMKTENIEQPEKETDNSKIA